MDLCIKTYWSAKYVITQQEVSILVLMDLCIKTSVSKTVAATLVSILVLMDLCKNTDLENGVASMNHFVSILVLMDLCIKTCIAPASVDRIRTANLV